MIKIIGIGPLSKLGGILILGGVKFELSFIYNLFLLLKNTRHKLQMDYSLDLD